MDAFMCAFLGTCVSSPRRCPFPPSLSLLLVSPTSLSSPPFRLPFRTRAHARVHLHARFAYSFRYQVREQLSLSRFHQFHLAPSRLSFGVHVLFYSNSRSCFFSLLFLSLSFPLSFRGVLSLLSSQPCIRVTPSYATCESTCARVGERRRSQITSRGKRLPRVAGGEAPRACRCGRRRRRRHDDDDGPGIRRITGRLENSDRTSCTGGEIFGDRTRRVVFFVSMRFRAIFISRILDLRLLISTL